MTTITTAQTALSEKNVLDSLRTSGFRYLDGWFYPAGDPQRAAVRFSVFGGQYQVWRRRKLRSPWMLVVTADTTEFDQDAFRTWSDTWPLTH